MAHRAFPALMVRHGAVSVFEVRSRLASFSSLPSSLPLIVLCAALFLPGIWSILALDRAEARFAVATREVVARGDLLRPRFFDADRLNQPIGPYCPQSVSLTALRRQGQSAIWPYRLASVVTAAFAVLLTF